MVIWKTMRNQYTSYIMSNYILLIIRIFNKNNKKYGLAGGDLYIWLFY
jgi:hypothetical protein